MEHKKRILDIEARAKLVGVAVRDICRAAKAAGARVNTSSFYRWKQDDANPRIRSMNRALDAMEAELARREGVVVRAIAERTPGVVEQALGGGQ